METHSHLYRSLILCKFADLTGGVIPQDSRSLPKISVRPRYQDTLSLVALIHSERVIMSLKGHKYTWLSTTNCLTKRPASFSPVLLQISGMPCIMTVYVILRLIALIGN